jgi:hypothetical protein
MGQHQTTTFRSFLVNQNPYLASARLLCDLKYTLMNKIYLAILVVLLGRISFAQNLVPNPGFEMYDSCPAHISQIHYATGWSKATWGTSDYFNECADSAGLGAANFAGYQKARTGKAYAGFFLYNWDILFRDENYREYVEVKLSEPLQKDQKYFVRFYVSFGDSGVHATSCVGAYLSSAKITNDTFYHSLNYLPQVENPKGNFLTDGINWTAVSGSFTAKGGESYITIGNFRDSSETDTLFVVDHDRGGFIVFYQDGYYYIDDVCVATDSTTCEGSVGIDEIRRSESLVLFPNPFGEVISISSLNSEATSISIYDYTSRLVLKEQVERTATINTEHLAKGIYFYEIRNRTGLIRKGKIVKE